MPSWISRMGIWKPAKEKVYISADPEKGIEEGYIYNGPDRAATAVLAEAKVDHLGIDCRYDPEVIMRARNLNMTVEEFLKLNEPPTPETVAAAKAAETAVQEHKPEKGKKGVSHKIDGLPMEGGFGDAPANAPVVRSS